MKGGVKGGIAFLVFAVLCFGALDTTTKVASATAPVLMALWVRYGVRTVVTAAALVRRRAKGSESTTAAIAGADAA